MIKRAGTIHVHVLAEEKPAGKQAVLRAGLRLPTLSAWGGSVLSVAIAWAVAMLLRQVLGVTSVALVFLMGVLASAVAYGLAASLLACLLSVLAYNFFFLPPLYTFTIADPENIVTLAVFAVVAMVASNLTARMRAQTVTAQARARTTEELYQFSRKLAGAVSLDDVLWATVHQVALMLKVSVVMLLPGDDGLAVQAGFPPDDQLDAADLAAAKWAWQHNRPAGRGADTLPGGKRLFLPMQTGRGPIGVFGIDRDDPEPLLTPDGQRLLNALSDQAALGDRAGQPGARRRPGEAAGGDRPVALRAAHLHLARSADPAGVHPGGCDEPDQPAWRAGRGGAHRHGPDHPGGGGSG